MTNELETILYFQEVVKTPKRAFNTRGWRQQDVLDLHLRLYNTHRLHYTTTFNLHRPYLGRRRLELKPAAPRELLHLPHRRVGPGSFYTIRVV